MIHTVKGFSVVNELEVDDFLEFLAHVLLKPNLENFEHYFANLWDEYNCAVV